MQDVSLGGPWGSHLWKGGEGRRAAWREEGEAGLPCRTSDSLRCVSWDGPSELYQVVVGWPRPHSPTQSATGCQPPWEEDTALGRAVSPLRQPQGRRPSQQLGEGHPFLKQGMLLSRSSRFMPGFKQEEGRQPRENCPLSSPGRQ